MKTILGLAIICFFVALAVFVGYRMSAEAMAVVIGVVCGVIASIPMSALILFLTQRQRRQPEMPQEPQWPPQYMSQRNMPPVVVIQGGQPMQRPDMMAIQPPMTATMPRQFKIIGENWATEEREDIYDDRTTMVR